MTDGAQSVDTYGSDESVDLSASQSTAQPRRFNIPLAYLRAFIIVLVVAHHAATSYHEYLPEGLAASLSDHYETMHGISPVNDVMRSGMLTLFMTFNDTFMMALMFLLSGLFVWGSLRRKGNARFLRDRLVRLGIPLLAMVLLRPLTHFPTYLQLGGTGGFTGFLQEWGGVAWRGGPLWYIEVLLLFNLAIVLFAGVTSGIRSSRERSSDKSTSDDRSYWGLPNGPARAFGALVVLSAIAYVPISAVFGSFWWVQVGPAQIEMNRLLYYAVYFLAGVMLGAYGIERTFLTPESSLARRWYAWLIAAVVVFAADIVAVVSSTNQILVGALFALASATISFALLALFLRFVRTQRRVWDSLFRNSYGIYLVHYGVVSWMAYVMLDVQTSAATKWLVVFGASLALCWGLIAAVRRIPLVARVI